MKKLLFLFLCLLSIHLSKAQNITYNFSGNSGWNDAANWSNNSIPPTVLPAASQININPSAGGQCILSTLETIAPGASLVVQQNAKFLITGNLILQPDTAYLPNTIDKTDTVKVMAYNVLNYGDGCQGTSKKLNGYFKTIIQYVQPDLLSCEKMDAFSPPQQAWPTLPVLLLIAY